jgi:hypothetical protein
MADREVVFLLDHIKRLDVNWKEMQRLFADICQQGPLNDEQKDTVRKFQNVLKRQMLVFDESERRMARL